MKASPLDTQETRLALLEQTASHIYESLERMGKQLSEVSRTLSETRDEIFIAMGQMEKKVDAKLEKINDRLEKAIIITEARIYKFMFGMFVVFGFIQHFIK